MKRTTPLMTVLTLTCALVGTASAQDSLELTGTLRDFSDNHPDMERWARGYPLVTGMVKPELDEDGLPVLNISQGQSIPSIWRIESTESFNQWYRNTEGVNQSIKHTIKLTDPDGDGVFRFEASKHNGQSFFPLDGKLFGNEGRYHNYHFTYQVHTKFTYTDPAQRDSDMTFSFSGDDDVWVFINKKLVVDIGGVHGEKYVSVNIDDLAEQLGMEPGGTYDFHFFFAERHTTESNFTMETTIQFLSPLYD